MRKTEKEIGIGLESKVQNRNRPSTSVCLNFAQLKKTASPPTVVSSSRIFLDKLEVQLA